MNARDLTWNVYRYDINHHVIYKYNVFKHGGFVEDVNNLFLEEDMSYEAFAETLKHSTMYFFWSKAEHEVVITSFPPYIDKREADRITKEECNYRMHVTLDCGKKIDIYDQLMMNWDAFVDYVWRNKK